MMSFYEVCLPTSIMSFKMSVYAVKRSTSIMMLYDDVILCCLSPNINHDKVYAVYLPTSIIMSCDYVGLYCLSPNINHDVM